MAYDEKLAARVRAALEVVPGCLEKKMFGGIGYLVNGNMACGINGQRLIVRLPEAEYAAALAQPSVHVFDMTGRPMKGWVTVDASAVEQDAVLQSWLNRGLAFARTLPPK